MIYKLINLILFLNMVL